MSEHDMLLRELRQAEQNFREADEEHVNIAIYNLLEVEEKINHYLEEQKAPWTATAAQEG
jgi:hypothetical protein|nr:MAG TPA: hypothetical protein [Caudoviricetes sp.]